ncbi:phosphatidylserine/phosphatidylglycerophosphate/cardiolipin synthase family protein [Naumannella sp. ID2617S]|nr:phosphatidylserine/phosphatidylglycerophosphate/cardiolipin synthase family protein [Naumannella sp. ID2617S]
MWWRRLSTAVRRAILAVFGVQLGTMLVLLLIDTHRKRDRKPVRFPKLAPVPVTVGDSRLTVYTYGQDLYDDMLAAIDQAQHTIYLETFIFKGDRVGRQFKRALLRAATRGVEVHLVVDEFANLVVPRRFFRFGPDVQVLQHPLVTASWDFWHPRNSGRNHRKLMVVDSKVGFIGGYNIGALYATDWRDTHCRVTGEAVGELENAFVDYWNLVKGRSRPALESSAPRSWYSPVKVHRNVPRQMIYPIRYMYLEAIDRASERIWLTHAYLIPDEDMIRALVSAVERGVDVRIIVPERSNHIVADWISRGYYRRLLAGGVRLFLYQGAMVHAKTALVDDAWATIGTANLDNLSLIGNYEVNLEITDADVNGKLAEVFALDLTNCRELTLDEWVTRPMMVKFSEAVLRPLSPFF